MDKQRAKELKRIADAIEVFLRREAQGAAIPRRVLRTLAPWLRAERRKLEKRAEKLDEWVMDLVSWQTVVWFRTHGCGWDNSLELAAEALATSKNTIKRKYGNFKKRYNLARGNLRLPRVLETDENFEPDWFLPEEHILEDLLAKRKNFLSPK